eukprot:3976741-Amphidinium_carterae.1
MFHSSNSVANARSTKAWGALPGCQQLQVNSSSSELDSCSVKQSVEREVSVDDQWKTGMFQVLGVNGRDELVYLGSSVGTQIEYDPMSPDQS